MAPEVLEKNYDEKCDVWSCGVVLYILLSGCPPFPGVTETEIKYRIKRGKFTFSDPVWLTVSEPAKDLIRKMLEYNPKKRISAIEALSHTWITKTKIFEHSYDLTTSTILKLIKFSVLLNFSF